MSIVNTMKLPQRIVFLIAVFVAIAVYFVYLHTFLPGVHLVIPDFRSALTLTVPEVHRVIPDFRSQLRETVRRFPEECRFAERKRPKDNIDTFDLLSDVGQGVQHEKQISKKPSDDVIKVFLIPHTHTDPGWLMTVEEYYKKQVKNILDNMVVKMYQYPEMTFVWAETIFLDIWWKDTDEASKRKFKTLVDKGRVEIINGGWVDPDEATTHYFAIIDQLIEGHQWVFKHLDVKPKVGWSPDPFGYSATMPYILRKAGIPDMVIVRIHDSIKARLRVDRNVEVQWRQAWDLSSDRTDALCHIMPYLYNSFHYSCGPHSSVCGLFDFLKKGSLFDNGETVKTYAEKLAREFRLKSQLFRHNVIFQPIGGDFRYETLEEWDDQYLNYKKLLQYINAHKELHMEVEFGTLSGYFDAVKKSGKTEGDFKVLHGDWFPYTDIGNQYWTGFFTSRPFWKQLGRELEGDLRAAEILNSLSNTYGSYYRKRFLAQDSNLEKLMEARRELAVFQHHGAITGTSREHTVEDYARRLWRAKVFTREVSAAAASYLLSEGKYQDTKDNVQIVYPGDSRDAQNPLRFKYTFQVLKNGTNRVILFNPSAKVREDLIRLHVSTPKVTVVDAYDQPVKSQINPVWERLKQAFSHSYELVFYANLLPLSMETFTIKPFANEYTNVANIRYVKRQGKAAGISLNNITITSNTLNVEFDGNGMLKGIKNMRDANGINITTSFHTYDSAGSGSYIFTANVEHAFRSPKFVIQVNGSLVSEVRVGYDLLEHNVRVFHTDGVLGETLEIENYVDMTPIQRDTEVFMRFDTSLKNKKVLYTDSNGYQMLRRERQDSFPIAGNFYPISDACYIEDTTTRLSLLAGQPHGVASLVEGQLDVILDRKLFRDDGKGLGEGAKDNVRTMSKFLLLLEQPIVGVLNESEANLVPYLSLASQTLLDRLLHPVVDFIVYKPYEVLAPVFYPLQLQLPCDVDLVNLKTMEPNSLELPKEQFIMLHRRGFQCGFSTYDLNCPLTQGVVDIRGLFRHIRPGALTEMSLSLMYENSTEIQNGKIHLGTMDIATYKIKYDTV